jgi:hypothetical protein
VLLAVEDGPGDLGGPLALVEERLALAVQEEELLPVDADEEDAPAGVDLQAAEAAGLRPARVGRR